MAYRAEIEIGVKGADKLAAFQKTLKETNKIFEITNKTRDIFEMPLQNVQNYTKTLREAARALQIVEIGTKEETTAIRNYVQAAAEAATVRDRQNKLMDEEAQKLGLLSQRLREYNAAAVPPTQRGAQTTMAGAYLRGQPSFGPELPPDFDPIAAAGRARASGLAAEAIKRGQGAQEAIRIINEVTEYQRRAFIDITNNKIQLTQKQLDAELDNIQITLDAAIKADKVEQEKWDRNLKYRTESVKQAEDIYLSIREESEKRIETKRKAGLEQAKKLEKEIAQVRESRARRRKEALGSAIIGGAFPLLFGQGPGAALGGAVGGGAGGLIGGQFGFGLSLVGTQIGVLFDQLASGSAALGQALNTLTADINAVVAATGKSNTTFAKNIKTLEEAGLKNTALSLATRELSNVVGTTGVSALQKFGKDTERLGQTFTKLTTQMQSDLARLVNAAGALGFVADRLEDKQLFELSKTSEDPRVVKARKEFNKARFSFSPTAAKQVEPLRRKLIEAQRKVVQEEAANIENLSKLALAEKKNLETAKQNLQNAERSFSVSDTANKLIEQQRKRQQEQLDFESRRNEIVTNYEKSIAALRRTVEDQISNLRLQNLKKANQLEDQRAANALATLRNQQAAARLFTVGASPQDPALRSTAESLRDAADAYSLKILETEQKRAKLERDSALSVQEIQFRADRFKLDVARQAAELGLNAQKQIDKINKTIVERNSKFELEKFRNEVKLADLQLNVLKAEVLFEAQKLADQRKTAVGQEANALDTQIQFLTQLNTAIDDNINTLKNVKPPKAFTEVAGIAAGGIDLTGYKNLVKEEIAITKQLKESRLDALSIEAQEAGYARLSVSAQALQKIENEVTDALFARSLELEKAARLSELTAELGSQALAQEITNIEFATRAQQAKIALVETELLAQQQLLETKVAEGTANETEIDQLERIKQLLIEINKLKGVVNTASESLKKDAKGEIQRFVEQATDELNNLEAVAVRVSQGIGNAIGSSLANGISSLIEGSATVKEVFADMLKSIGQVLVQEGTKMIATYIAIGIAKAFAGMGGAYGSGAEKPLTSGMDYSSAFSSGGFGITPRANGGPVNRNSAYIVGENGPELFRPTQAGRIDSNSDLRSAMSRQRSNVPTMNFSFETTNIGGTEYVSREQLEAAMALTRRQAANDGAKRGMNMTLDKMQNSPRTRSRVGIS